MPEVISSHNSHESSQDSHDSHDSSDKDGYKKRCRCEKCVKKYKEWCEEHRKDGDKTCKRRCHTVCEVKCEKKSTIKKEWGYKKLYEGKWEHHDAKEPKYCDKHKKSDCGCN